MAPAAISSNVSSHAHRKAISRGMPRRNGPHASRGCRKLSRGRRHESFSAVRAALGVRPLVTGERVIRGSSNGSARTREDLPRLVELYRGGRLKLDELITRRYGLDEANEAFRALAAGELARGLIVF
jgi:D-arabinose 1-dehydrogenase-like Zn-dependent alcohol dehydrogenase